MDMYLNPTLKKLKFKGPATLLQAPAAIEKEWMKEGLSNKPEKEPWNNLVVFINNKKELLQFLSTGLPKVAVDTVLWLAYPKGRSGIKTDIHRDIIRETAAEFAIRPVAAISIDDTWSALRFRPADKVGK